MNAMAVPKRKCFLSSVQFSSVAQSYPTLCDPMNRSTPGLHVHHQLPEFTQTHVHRVASVLSNSSATPWTVACQTPLFMEFSRQEYWSELPFPSPGDIPHPGIEPSSLAAPSLTGGILSTEPPGKPSYFRCTIN